MKYIHTFKYIIPIVFVLGSMSYFRAVIFYEQSFYFEQVLRNYILNRIDIYATLNSTNYCINKDERSIYNENIEINQHYFESNLIIMPNSVIGKI